MARKKKAEVLEAEEPKVEVAPEPEVSFGKCKACSSELKKMLYDSRAEKPLYLYVCNNGGCPLYRQPQKYDGVLPGGVNIVIA